MKVLIIGSGGREHALAWRSAQSPLVEWVYVAPGNGGTAGEPKVTNIPIPASDIQRLVEFARREAIDLTIVGPEAPLVAGVTDAFANAGLRCFGPSQAAAQLEGSKSFAKDFMRRHGIPTAEYAVFSELDAAFAHLKQVEPPIVIKADGLAAGKGVVVAQDLATAESAVCAMLGARQFGNAGAQVVIEEYLSGEEASFIALVDGRHILPLASSQDHKRRDDGDRGPNTGGMGAYSPAPVVTPEVHERILREVMEPTVAGMAAEGCPYVGFLYAGLMIAPDGSPRVLEFNCRLGDPETQPILIRLQSDLVELCMVALTGELDRAEARWDPRAALGVVMAAAGYPGEVSKGQVIEGLERSFPPEIKVFHAGTRREGERVLTDGGRVLCVTALGVSIAEACSLAYDAVDRIYWEGAFWRRDIGHRAIARGL
ncbi:phosphoribosylamine--glycine ligase [Caldichromatium japonicum]|uniref:Phosphoribosylamine--glycine ligase n=1 Tax=Caldichromatium japonicum TaxID=2699430 RepID=A0A6G7VFH7_9GAMM|nr:phosphoribosylamine--glycine ligase [Caldichromatium japonicum]QIK38833.1 phosphoribosylamine--glycine ligase [Caldichromatium japonicum]